MRKRKYVRTRSLKTGMRIDQTVLDGKGRALIVRGTYLDDFMIETLLRLGVGGIYTSEGEDDPDEAAVSPEVKEKIEKLKKADPATVRLTESVKKRVSEGIQYLYQDTASERFLRTANNIANDLMNAVLDNNAIAVDIGVLKVSDEYTFKHSVDVATIAMVIARKHGLRERKVYEIGVTGLLHDIGKSKIPSEVLNKPGRLTPEEFAMIKQHSLLGYQILEERKGIKNEIRQGVLQHHEKINGKGCPFGVSADDICDYAKIISVADIYDALVTKRPYKDSLSQRDAVELIMSMTGELDIGVMKSFLGSVILYPVGSTVRLSNGENARVVRNDPDCILRPTVVGLSSGRVYDLANDLGCASVIIL